MPQVYGGTLGLIAFLAIAARGLVHNAPAANTLLAATLSLPVFFTIGCVVGWIADRTIDESIRTKIGAYITTETENADSAATSG